MLTLSPKRQANCLLRDADMTSTTGQGLGAENHAHYRGVCCLVSARTKLVSGFRDGRTTMENLSVYLAGRTLESDFEANRFLRIQ